MPKTPDSIDAFVGGCIAQRPVAMGLSQTALGSRLGISFQQIQKYESGTNRVSASRLHGIGLVLGAPVSSFFPDISCETEPRPESERRPAGLRFLSASPEGRAVAEGFPLIESLAVRKAVACLVEALATP